MHVHCTKMHTFKYMHNHSNSYNHYSLLCILFTHIMLKHTLLFFNYNPLHAHSEMCSYINFTGGKTCLMFSTNVFIWSRMKFNAEFNCFFYYIFSNYISLWNNFAKRNLLVTMCLISKEDKNVILDTALEIFTWKYYKHTHQKLWWVKKQKTSLKCRLWRMGRMWLCRQ